MSSAYTKFALKNEHKQASKYMNKSLILTITVLSSLLLIQNIIYSESTPAPTEKSTQPQSNTQPYEDYNRLIAPSGVQNADSHVPVTEYSPTTTTGSPAKLKRKKRSSNSGLSFKQMADGIQKKDTEKTSLSFKSLSNQVKNKETTSSSNMVEQLKKKQKN